MTPLLRKVVIQAPPTQTVEPLGILAQTFSHGNAQFCQVTSVYQVLFQAQGCPCVSQDADPKGRVRRLDSCPE